MHLPVGVDRHDAHDSPSLAIASEQERPRSHTVRIISVSDPRPSEPSVIQRIEIGDEIDVTVHPRSLLPEHRPECLIDSGKVANREVAQDPRQET